MDHDTLWMVGAVGRLVEMGMLLRLMVVVGMIPVVADHQGQWAVSRRSRPHRVFRLLSEVVRHLNPGSANSEMNKRRKWV
jgi:hypothetical protein